MTDSNCCFSMLKELVDPNYKNVPFLTTMTRDNNSRNTSDSFAFICKAFETHVDTPVHVYKVNTPRIQ